MLRSYYHNIIQNFTSTSSEEIFGVLTQAHQFALEERQKNAWLKQIQILKNSFAEFEEGHLFFEFSIPRMGKRVDNILIIKNLIFVIEFKVGEKEYSSYAKTQTIDYCLDLLNFHAESYNRKVIPVLVATQADEKEIDWSEVINLEEVVCCNELNLKETIEQIIQQYAGLERIDAMSWLNSIYKPTPTIIEAAQALYQGHQVEEISRSDAGAINLELTSKKIESIIEKSKQNNQKAICFLTGVPGAGKTLAGLNIANQRLKVDESEHSVFLSGNGPLVDVLREALTRNTVEIGKSVAKNIKRSEAERGAKTFIQNIHHFRDHYLKSAEVPIEKVVIFDEAQRAWKKEQVSNFMKQKKGIDDFDMSEPEFLIRVMDRHQDWCVIVCLIGGGQEINTGEAGVTEWISALRQNYPNWNIYYSDKVLNEPVYLAETEQKKWLKTKAKGSERYGVIASSGARRLKADGIDVKNKISPADWFLNYKTDVRSSYYLEEIATEFDIQGLEIDFTCLAWDINFYYDNGWRYQSFKGTCWQQIKQNEKQKYLLNAYRMLLTRARQGMVIYIPNVDDCDWTRPKSKYDSTYKYLKTCGFEEII
ncbi:DNA/RNA helicase domain-containing protein [Acinetobacter sp. ANC 3781]